MDKVAQNGFSSGEDFSSKMFVLGSEYLLSMAACKRYKRQNGINKKTRDTKDPKSANENQMRNDSVGGKKQKKRDKL